MIAIPTLQEIVGGEWKKEGELKGLKSEVAALERKIQLTLAPPQQSEKENSEQKQEAKAVSSVGSDSEQFVKDHIIIARPKPPTSEAAKGFKLFLIEIVA